MSADVYIHNINPFEELSFGTEYFWFPALLGNNATLNMFKSKIDLYFTSTSTGAVAWTGGTANIVSSLTLGQGLSIADLNKQGVLNFVNSVFLPAEDSPTARIQAFYGGVANIIASTLQHDASETVIPNFQFCANSLYYYPCNGAPLQVFGDGEIHLQSSAISVLNEDLARIQYPYSNQFDPQTAAPIGGIFSADSYSYVKPVIKPTCWFPTEPHAPAMATSPLVPTPTLLAHSSAWSPMRTTSTNSSIRSITA